MKTVAWENGRPLHADKQGNLWRFKRNSGGNGCVIESVGKTLVQLAEEGKL